MGPEDYIASIGLTAATFAPRNTALCQGQTIAINQNQALFSLMGTTYGGDGRSTFQLPDLRGVVPFGTGQQPDTGSNWSLGTRTDPLTRTSWPQGFPAAATGSDTPTVPTATGPAGIALNWAITLYGYFPPRDY